MKKSIIIAILSLAFFSSPARGVNLKWNYDGSASITRFDLFRADPVTGTWQKIASLTPEARTMLDRDLVGGSSYCYHIAAVSSAVASPNSSDACVVAAGVSVTLKAWQTLAVSRRATNGSSTVALLINNDEVMKVNSPDIKPGEITINLRQGLFVVASRRSTSGSSTVGILVDKDEVVAINGQVIVTP